VHNGKGVVKTMITLMDLRHRPSDPIVATANRDLRWDDTGYVAHHGEVGSDRWWEDYDRGAVPHDTLLGVITLVGGLTDEFGETEQVVAIEADTPEMAYPAYPKSGKTVVYPLVGYGDIQPFWLEPASASNLPGSAWRHAPG
jgi:hypothetical protein